FPGAPERPYSSTPSGSLDRGGSPAEMPLQEFEDTLRILPVVSGVEKIACDHVKIPGTGPGLDVPGRPLHEAREAGVRNLRVVGGVNEQRGAVPQLLDLYDGGHVPGFPTELERQIGPGYRPFDERQPPARTQADHLIGKNVRKRRVRRQRDEAVD